MSTTCIGLRTTFSFVIRRIILLAAALAAVLTGAAVSAAQTDDLPVVLALHTSVLQVLQTSRIHKLAVVVGVLVKVLTAIVSPPDPVVFVIV